MNFIGHLKTVLKHKWQVFKLSIKAGIPLRGLMHDLSKFSYIEFSESTGKKKSNTSCKRKKWILKSMASS